MAKETMKDKLVRLESEVNLKDVRIQELNSYIDEHISTINRMQDQANDSFANSTDKKHLHDKIFMLEQQLRSQQHRTELAEKKVIAWDKQLLEMKVELDEATTTIKKLKDQNSKVNASTIHNERGAGRHSKLSPEQLTKVYELRAEGVSMAKIAKEVGCSVGLIHKIMSNTDS